MRSEQSGESSVAALFIHSHPRVELVPGSLELSRHERLILEFQSTAEQLDLPRHGRQRVPNLLVLFVALLYVHGRLGWLIDVRQLWRRGRHRSGIGTHDDGTVALASHDHRNGWNPPKRKHRTPHQPASL